VINTETEDLVKRVAEITNGVGVHGVAECIGGKVAEQCAAALAKGGKLLGYGNLSGQKPNYDMKALEADKKSIDFFWLTGWIQKHGIPKFMAVSAAIWPMMAGPNPKVRLPIEARYDLSRIVEAVAHSTKVAYGKILLVNSPPPEAKLDLSKIPEAKRAAFAAALRVPNLQTLGAGKVVRFVRFPFGEGKEAALRQFLAENVPKMKAFPGVHSLNVAVNAAEHTYAYHFIFENKAALVAYRASQLFVDLGVAGLTGFGAGTNTPPMEFTADLFE